MYAEHPEFDVPEQNTVIWRYMDFAKFASLLHKESLFFVRTDRLSDPFEGSYSRANVEQRRTLYRHMSEEAFNTMRDNHKRFSMAIKQHTMTNSWHMNEHESDAMWKLYLTGTEGVAIQSTFGRLAGSFRMYQPDVHIGIVKYIDRGKDFIPEGNSFYPFFHKSRSLEHENELRAIIQELPYGEYVEGWIQIESDLLEQEVSDNGVYIPVDLDLLIERVIVSPTAPEWFGELVEALANKYDLKKDVKPSSLDDDPVF